MRCGEEERNEANRRIIDRFGERSAASASNDELRTLLGEAAAELGFDHFAMVHHAAIAALRPGLIRIHDYPSAWEEEVARTDFARSDPVHRASLRTHAGFCWSELDQLVAVGRRERGMLERASQHGIGDGFTVPVNVPGEPSGSCSFAVNPGKQLPHRRLFCAEQIGLHAFKAARRINNYPVVSRTPKLSPRERECVRLVAAGKTDWEVAAILGISIETAHQYIKRARTAYDVVSRAQLVACGLRDAIISFDEAIPPNG